MKMILQLLLAVTIGWAAADSDIPPFKQLNAAVNKAVDNLKVNLISLEDHVPLLNDTRRQYAVIAHVIYYHASSSLGCLVEPYYEVYQRYLNSSVPEALSNPLEVVGEFKDLLQKVNRRTHALRVLIESCKDVENVCDEFIFNSIEDDVVDFEEPENVFLYFSDFAQKLNDLNSNFEAVSKDLDALHYVLKSPEALEDVVKSLTDVIRELRENVLLCPLLN